MVGWEALAVQPLLKLLLLVSIIFLHCTHLPCVAGMRYLVSHFSFGVRTLQSCQPLNEGIPKKLFFWTTQMGLWWQAQEIPLPSWEFGLTSGLSNGTWLPQSAASDVYRGFVFPVMAEDLCRFSTVSCIRAGIFSCGYGLKHSVGDTSSLLHCITTEDRPIYLGKTSEKSFSCTCSLSVISASSSGAH